MNLKPLVAALVTAFTLQVGIANAEFNPAGKQVNVIMPFAPGGGVDQTFRHLQTYAAKKGVTLVGIYKPGAEGLIAMSELVTKPADGFTVSVTTAGVIANYRLKNPSTDIVAISGIRDSIMALVVSNKSQIESLEQLDKDLKEGKKLNVGYGAPGQQMFLEQFFELAKAKKQGPTMVPYKGGGPVVTDILGGHIDVAAVPLSIVRAHIESGKVKLIGLASRAKIDGYDSIPLMKNKYPKWEEFDNFAFVAEKGTDKEAITWWSNFLKDYINDESVRKEFTRDLTVPVEFGTANLERTIQSSINRLKKNGN